MVKSLTSKPLTMNCSRNNIYAYISLILGIIINLIFIISLNNLEHSNCKCTDQPHRRFLKEWFMIVIFWNISLIILFSISNEACWANFMNHPYIYGILSIIAIINIVMLIRLFLYILALRKNCSCGYGNKEKFIFWYFIILFSMLAFLLLLIITFLLLTIIKFFNN
jgi:hypothetical protein